MFFNAITSLLAALLVLNNVSVIVLTVPRSVADMFASQPGKYLFCPCNPSIANFFAACIEIPDSFAVYPKSS